MNWSASTITTALALVSPSKTLISVPVVVIAVEPLILGDVKVLLVKVSVVVRPTRVSDVVGSVNVPLLLICAITGVVSVLLVSVCEPVSVTTLLSIASVMLLPLRLEVKPVPPKMPNTSESKSIEPLLEPSVMSKSSAVIADSTNALIDCCDATAVALFDEKSSSSKKAEPDNVPFSTGAVKVGDVSVLFVRVCVPERVTTVASTAKVTLLPLAVVLIPTPPSKPNVSLSKSIAMVVLPSVISKSCKVTCAST